MLLKLMSEKFPEKFNLVCKTRRDRGINQEHLKMGITYAKIRIIPMFKH